MSQLRDLREWDFWDYTSHVTQQKAVILHNSFLNILQYNLPNHNVDISFGTKTIKHFYPQLRKWAAKKGKILNLEILNRLHWPIPH